MRWKVHGRRTMYQSDWVNVYLDDVELPDGSHIDHHVLTMPKSSQTAVVLNDAGDKILLIWRHRFITGKWGWEVPAGWVEPGEDAEQSIRREILEETGYAVDGIEQMVEYDAIPGLSDMHFVVWKAIGGRPEQEPLGDESSAIQWHPANAVAELISNRQVHDGPSLMSLTFWHAFGR